MRINSSGKAFYHPVTHQLIEPGQFYEGAAYLPHENQVTPIVIDVKVEVTTDPDAVDKAVAEVKDLLATKEAAIEDVEVIAVSADAKKPGK